MNNKVTWFILFFGLIISGCFSKKATEVQAPTDEIYTNTELSGSVLEVNFVAGPEHNHPLMALWIEDTKGNYLQTIYVANSIAKGIYQHGDASSGKWMPGEVRRPAALPVWSHSRNIKASDGLYIPTADDPMPDAITGPTPKVNFRVLSPLKRSIPETFILRFEINQTWDFNEFWTNSKYPDNEEYKTSCQPALIYSAKLSKSMHKPVNLELIGHAHYAGEDGKIYEDLSTFTTAIDITESITARIRE